MDEKLLDKIIPLSDEETEMEEIRDELEEEGFIIYRHTKFIRPGLRDGDFTIISILTGITASFCYDHICSRYWCLSGFKEKRIFK